MPLKVQDIRESYVANIGGHEFLGIEEYTMSRRIGSVGIDFTITFPKMIADLFAVGDPVSFKGIEGFVTSVDVRRAEGGFETVVSGVSKIGELMRKSPIKSLTYMSMTNDEKFDFDVTCTDAWTNKVDYDDLDYIPLIKICDPRKFTGGWNIQDVLHDLIVTRGGFGLVCNVYNFWVRQVHAPNSASYFDTAIGLVNFLRPIIYVDEAEECVYILDRPVLGGTVNFNIATQISQRQVFNYESKAKYFRVQGGYGLWDRNKSQLSVHAEREVTLTSTMDMEKPIIETVNMVGDLEVTKKDSGLGWTDEIISGTKTVTNPDGTTGQVQQASFTYSFWLSTPMREKQTTTEVWRLDPYGNFKCLRSRHIVKENSTLSLMIGEFDSPIKELDSTETYDNEFMSEEYERSRLKTKTVTVGQYAWEIFQHGGGPGVGIIYDRKFKGGVTETEEYYDWSNNGTLRQKTVTIKRDCVRWASSGPPYSYVDITLADAYWRDVGSTEDVQVERMVVEERVTLYRQINATTYEEQTTTRKLGPLARVKGQENFVQESVIVRGRVPREPVKYRTMIVYCDNIPEGKDADASTDVPVMELSNPNIIDWGDAEAIYGRLVDMAAESNVTERVITIPGDVPIDIGWQVGLPTVFVGKKWEGGVSHPLESTKQSIPGVVPANWCYIVSWQKAKRASDVSCTTTITVQAR